MIYFRADANENIGLGHTMRCLALADAFRSLGQECCFIIASDSGNESLIRERGYSVKRLNNGYLNMDEETKELGRILSDSEILYIVDSYFVPEGYYEKVKSMIAGKGKVICFDDMIETAFPTDGLINYNVYADSAKVEELYRRNEVPLPDCYLGISYAPLRMALGELPKELIIDRKGANEKHVLLSCGGADPDKVTVRFLEYLRQNGSTDEFVFHIPVGAVNASAPEIRSLAKDLDRVVLYDHIREFRAFIRQMDFAVSAAGSTVYELCAEGIPSITYVLADNQMGIAKEFDRLGLVPFAGDCRNNEEFVSGLMRCLHNLSSRNDLDDLKKKMQNTVDGLGAKRLAEALLKDNRG